MSQELITSEEIELIERIRTTTIESDEKLIELSKIYNDDDESEMP